MDVFEAISDPTRRRIIELVAVAPRSAGDIAAEFTISRPAVSQQLAALSSSGVLEARKEGRKRIYTLNTEALQPPSTWLEDQRRRWNTALDRLEKTVIAEEGHSNE